MLPPPTPWPRSLPLTHGGERDKEQEEGSNISGAAAVQVRADGEAMRLAVEKGAVKGADGWSRRGR
jgi:hypothetical protein